MAETTFTYDNLERLTGIEHSGPALGALGAPHYSYSYDPLDRIVTFAAPDDAVTYTYDAISQLVAADQ